MGNKSSHSEKNMKLFDAAKNGRLEDLKSILKLSSVDINWAYPDRYGETPLSKAANNGDFLVVKMLLEHGADVNKANNYAQTPLYAASYNGHFPVVQMLLKHGADVEKADKKGETPLLIASLNDHPSIVKVL